MIGDTEKGQTEDIGGIIKVTGLTSNTIYKNVRMRIYDKAGNYQDTFPIAIITRMPNGPKITILNNTSWSTTKTAQITGKEGFVIKYTLDGTEPSISNGTELTGTGVKSITIDRENCRVRAIYLNNETEMATDIGISDEAKVDKTGPSISLSVSSGTTSISASWSASDAKTSLSSSPYRYKVGSSGSWSSWTTSTSVTYTTGDTAQSGYFYVEAKDALGNTSTASRYYSTSGKPAPVGPQSGDYYCPKCGGTPPGAKDGYLRFGGSLYKDLDIDGPWVCSEPSCTAKATRLARSANSSVTRGILYPSVCFSRCSGSVE